MSIRFVRDWGNLFPGVRWDVRLIWTDPDGRATTWEDEKHREALYKDWTSRAPSRPVTGGNVVIAVKLCVSLECGEQAQTTRISEAWYRRDHMSHDFTVIMIWVRESAGINRLGIENERVLRRTTSH